MNKDPRNTALLAATTVLCLAVIEITLRTLFGFGNPVLYYQDGDVGLYTLPNQTITRLYGSEIRINSRGFRYDELPERKEEGERRIFVLGDSITYGGEYITTGDLFTNIFERELQQKTGGKVRVINAGTNAHSITNMEEKYAHKIRDLSPDAVILYVPEGDFYRKRANLEHGLVGPFWDSKPYLALQDVANYALQYIKLRITPEKAGADAGSLGVNMKSLERLADETRGDGVELYVVITPNRRQVYEDEPTDAEVRDRLGGLIPEDGIIYLRDCFRKNKDNEIYRDVVHYLPKGHETAAGCLTETVGDRIV